RRKQGIPRVDKHIYARENGWIIDALTAAYEATGDPTYLDESLRVANWFIANRSLPAGGFSHDTKDASGPFLGDSLSMTRAFESLYTATGDRQWLKRAQETVAFIANNFSATEMPGYVTSKVATD